MPTHLRVRIGALLTLVVVAVVIAVLVDVPSVGQLRDRFADTGILGGLVFAISYAFLSLLPLPATVFTIAAGAVFGLGRGIPIVVLGASVGAVVAFFLGRALGRDAVQHFTGARVQTLDRFLARQGFWAILTARLVPVVPFTALNYLSGFTGVRASRYTAATVLGILPGTVAYVAIGAYGTEPTSAPFLVSIGALLVLTAVGIIVNRRRRSRSMPATPVTEPSGAGEPDAVC